MPEGSHTHVAHIARRSQGEAKAFVEQIREDRDGQVPLFESDGGLYEEVLTDVYGALEQVPYKATGRKPFPRQTPNAQVVKERENGKVVDITTRIVLGDKLEILGILDKSERCNTISTSFVESRNGAFRKDNKRHTRKTKCHSKRIKPHYARAIFLKGVCNLTKGNEKFKISLNPDAKRFQTKYRKVSPAMEQGLANKIYP